MEHDENDNLISIDDAARHEIPKSDGKTVHRSSIIRWHARGVLARNGERIRLKLVRFGKRYYVTRRSLREFGEALSAADVQSFDEQGGGDCRPRVTSLSEKQRESNITDAERRLASAGL